MGKQKLKGKDLRKIGFSSDQAKSLAINIMAKFYKHLNKTKKLELLKDVMKHPEEYKTDKHLKSLAACFLPEIKHETHTAWKLNKKVGEYTVFGRPFISHNTLHQMDLAMSLPVAEKGAIMPDAHVGYGLPIGGVLATKNEVIPYAVGLDIGCRMALSVFDIPVEKMKGKTGQLKRVLMDHTHFGMVKKRPDYAEHAILEDPLFKTTTLLKQLRGKAIMQLGTSGAGNHFVEFGVVELPDINALDLPGGQYYGLLSHSGSRGLGATIAQYYSRLAADLCRLPKGAQHLAWLDMDSAEGQEYWLAMNLAGEYAKACHDVIHNQLAKTIGARIIKKVENHHNFAWKEQQADGTALIVHRKGATPAAKGELGIIPGTMISPAYIVSGKGDPAALNSASHGAGRLFSRSKAREKFTRSEMRQLLKNAGVTTIGSGVDESPRAYKDIEKVIGAQQELVQIAGEFTPRIVRMCK